MKFLWIYSQPIQDKKIPQFQQMKTNSLLRCKMIQKMIGDNKDMKILLSKAVF